MPFFPLWQSAKREKKAEHNQRKAYNFLLDSMCGFLKRIIIAENKNDLQSLLEKVTFY